VDLQLGGALYGNMEIFDGVRTGGADAGHYVIESGDGFYYSLATALPFWNFPDNETAVDSFWTLYEQFPQIEEEFSAVGLHYGTHFAMPPIHIHWHDAGVEVSSPDQMQGKTLLTLESFVAEWFSLYGASMENPAFPDLFSMIDTQATDGYVQHGPFLGGFDLVDDFQSHTIFGDGGVLQLSIGIIWNKDTWDSLPADIQQVALDAREVYLETFNAGSTADNEAFLAQIEADNHTVVNLTPEQIVPWKQGLESVYKDWIASAPDPAVAQQMYDKLTGLTAQ
jgi:TRAP-type C4-dicarboxylate transport system substrate-binding protein